LITARIAHHSCFLFAAFFLVREAAEKENFCEALELEEKTLKRDPFGWHGYFNDGLYARQLRAWFDHYPQESFLVLLTENLQSKPDEMMTQTFCFLGLNCQASINLGVKKTERQLPDFLRLLSSSQGPPFSRFP